MSYAHDRGMTFYFFNWNIHLEHADAIKALALINTMESGGRADLEFAINNVKQMAYLSAYYAHKVRGATYKKAGESNKAMKEMGKAYCRWMAYSRSMDDTYHGDSFRNLSIAPDWKFADAAVLKEYIDLGRMGRPPPGRQRVQPGFLRSTVTV